MRTRTFATITAAAVAVAGCRGGSQLVNEPRPPAPVNLAVYVNDSRISVSPDTVGAGQIIFIVTNQASRTESLTVHPSGNPNRALASTGPINPEATAQVTVDLQGPRDYTIAAGKDGTNEAARATATPIEPGRLHVGRPRRSASNALLQP